MAGLVIGFDWLVGTQNGRAPVLHLLELHVKAALGGL